MNRNTPLRIGLTGGIASGKSTVAAFFKKLGADIIDADQIAKELMLPCHPNFKTVVDHFGPTILNSDDSLNRQALRDIISNDNKANQWLKDLLHPQIFSTIMQRSQQSKSPYCILMIPLLAESKYDYQLDRICVVNIDPAIQIQHLMDRDHTSKVKAEQLIQLQINPNDRLAIADDIIVNDNDLTDLDKQVHTLHQKYLELSYLK